MVMKHSKILFLIITTLGIIAGRSIYVAFQQNKPTASPEVYTYESSYAGLTRDEMLAEADAIIIGEVVAVTPAQWNQDSGKPWKQSGFASIPYHELEVRIIEPLYDTLDLKGHVRITVLGASPTGTVDPSIILDSPPAHKLVKGQKAMFFLVKRELAWRGPENAQQQSKRPIIRLVGQPDLSYLIQEADGLYHSTDPSEKPSSRGNIADKIKQR